MSETNKNLPAGAAGQQIGWLGGDGNISTEFLVAENGRLRSRLQTAEKERDEAREENSTLKNPPDSDCWLALIKAAECDTDPAMLIMRITSDYVRMRLGRDAARERAKFASETLFFANLSPEDYAKFEAQPFGYSGATGAGAKPEDYNGIGPYIATYMDQMQAGMATFGWEAVHLEHKAGQWIARDGTDLIEERDAAVKRACQLEGKLVAAIVQQHKSDNRIIAQRAEIKSVADLKDQYLKLQDLFVSKTHAQAEEIRRLREALEKVPHAPSCPQDQEVECDHDCPGCIQRGASIAFGPAKKHRLLPRKPCDCWKSTLTAPQAEEGTKS